MPRERSQVEWLTRGRSYRWFPPISNRQPVLVFQPVEVSTRFLGIPSRTNAKRIRMKSCILVDARMRASATVRQRDAETRRVVNPIPLSSGGSETRVTYFRYAPVSLCHGNESPRNQNQTVESTVNPFPPVPSFPSFRSLGKQKIGIFELRYSLRSLAHDLITRYRARSFCFNWQVTYLLYSR